jgi:hypothetical protein
MVRVGRRPGTRTDIPSACPLGEHAGVPWTGRRNSDVTGPVGASPERRGSKPAERKRGARSAEGLQGSRWGVRHHVADRDPERPADGIASAISRAKPERGARGKPRATQLRNALERRTPGEQRAGGRLTPVRSLRISAGSKALKPARSGAGCGPRVTPRCGQVTAGGQRASRGVAAPREGKASKGETPGALPV